MKKNFTILTLFALGLAFSQHSIAENILNSYVDTDGNLINAHAGGVIYKKGKYYWYGEYRNAKPDNGSHWDSNQKVMMYVSTNMQDWKKIGTILDVSDSPENWDLERPKIIYNKKNKEYIMWFHMEPNRKYTEGYAGVAVSKNISGPYNFISATRPNKNQLPIVNYQPDNNSNFVKKADEVFDSYIDRGQQVRDLTAFVDDDGKAYLIYESEDDFSMQVVQLSEDYKSFTKRYSRILIGKQNEAPAVFKQNGQYFLITSGLSGYKPNPPRLAKANSIFGPWKELGSPIFSNDSFISKNLYDAQSTYIFFDPASNKNILMMDKWNISNGGYSNLWKSTYIWTTISNINDQPAIEY